MSDPFGYDYLMSGGGKLRWGTSRGRRTAPKRIVCRNQPGPFCYSKNLQDKIDNRIAITIEDLSRI